MDASLDRPVKFSNYSAKTQRYFLFAMEVGMSNKNYLFFVKSSCLYLCTFSYLCASTVRHDLGANTSKIFYELLSV